MTTAGILRAWLVSALVALTISFGDMQAHGAGRSVLSLDGVWQFATDPGDVGERERWFLPDRALPAMPREGYSPQAKGAIRVPGAWDAQGYGVETDKLRHQFDGRGWYRRQVTIPAAWQGRRVFLTLGGVMRSARIWVNSRFEGEHIGYVSAFEYDITNDVKPGQEALITIAVDSRWDLERDPLMGCGLFMDYMGSGYGKVAGYNSVSEGTWGGLWGHVRLEARNEVWLDELSVDPQVSPPSCDISARWHGRLDLSEAVRVEVKDGHKTVLTRTVPMEKAIKGNFVRVSASDLGEIPRARLWSFRHPYLYRVVVTLLRGDEVIDQVHTPTGLREIRVDGSHFVLNGERVFMSGYGDDAIYPATTAWPTDVRVYRERLRLIKSYGFNYVRHHSHMLPDEYYDACDEVGMMVQAESPIAYGYRAKNEATKQIYMQEWRGGILRHRNHPSLVTLCVGNEGGGSEQVGREYQRVARELGGRRLFIGTDGIQHGGWEGGESDLMDFLTPQFDVFQSVLDVPAKFAFTGTPAKPVIAHEEGNYVAFPRFDQIPAWQHLVKPFWLTWGRERFARMGLLDETPQWAENSERLYYMLHKLNLESLRLNPRMAGYNWWLFQDFWTTHNGIVDAYYRPKPFLTRERIRQFNGDIVVLQQGLAASYRGGEACDLKYLLSNYGEGDLPSGELTWRIQVGGKTAARNTQGTQSIQQGELVKLATVHVPLPEPTRPELIRVEAQVSYGSRRFKNDWTGWLYPAHIPVPPLSRPLFADPGSLALVSQFGAQPIPPGATKPADALYVCRRGSPAVLDAVERGAQLVLLPSGESLPGTRSRYKLPWWRAGREGNNIDEGTVVYPNPATRDIAPDGWCDAHWYELIEGAFGVFLDDLPHRPEVLIRGIEGPIEARDKAFLFRGRLGQGTVVVSGLNHTRAAKLPINQWLLARLLESATAPERPAVALPRSFLSSSPVAPGCLAGFVRFTAHRGEEMPWFTYREDMVTTHICRQTSPTNKVEWETAPAPVASTNETTCFVFAGGLGFVSQPDAGGFRLTLNGAPVLDFDVTMESRTWTSQDGKLALRFEVKRKLDQDALGFFYLTVPRGRLEPGAPCCISVTAQGSGSRRWFALHPYTDLADE